MQIIEVDISRPKGKEGNHLDIVVKCSDGKWYELNDLLREMGIERNCFNNRIHRHGWDHEYLLAPPAPKGKRIDGENNSPLSGNSEWESMK